MGVSTGPSRARGAGLCPAHPSAEAQRVSEEVPVASAAMVGTSAHSLDIAAGARQITLC